MVKINIGSSFNEFQLGYYPSSTLVHLLMCTRLRNAHAFATQSYDVHCHTQSNSLEVTTLHHTQLMNFVSDNME